MKRYKILVKLHGYRDWQDEKFLTGGNIYHSFKDAIDTKNKCQALSNLNRYKVVLL